jgi:hypothetical protein
MVTLTRRKTSSRKVAKAQRRTRKEVSKRVLKPPLCGFHDCLGFRL